MTSGASARNSSSISFNSSPERFRINLISPMLFFQKHLKRDYREKYKKILFEDMKSSENWKFLFDPY
jgi:hypothetical protein